jgi:hypothetical protein
MDMAEEIKIGELFHFDQLLADHPGKRIKLRFNKSWDDWNRDGQRIRRDFYQMYATDNAVFVPWMLSSYSGKGRARNRNDDIQFQLIEIANHQWLFVGAYIIDDIAAKTFSDSETIHDDVPYASARKMSEYAPYEGRAVFNWTLSRNHLLVKPSDIKKVPLNRILPGPILENGDDFPGYDAVNVGFEDLATELLNDSWGSALRNVYGVYLITDEKTGKQYVGSATGDAGIWGRWNTYIQEGYDPTEEADPTYPNKGLNELVQQKGLDYIRKHFSYAILEVFAKNPFGKSQALDRESHWKKTLRTREFGYNLN